MDRIIPLGVTIGNSVIIGARSVVTRDVPDNSVAAGVLAKIIKKLDKFYEKQRRNH